MIETKQLKQLKKQYGHLFHIEDNGNITLKDKFGIPPFKLIFIQGGEFIIGDLGEKRKVKLSPYFMAEYLVTQELYKAVTGENPSYFQGVNHPVERINWYNAIEFCQILNEKLKIVPAFYEIDKSKEDESNKSFYDKLRWKVYFDQKSSGFRLPTEAEWESAARGILTALKQYELSGSNNLDDVGWFSENNSYETKPVGLKFPNNLGIYDMSGNVWEWCWDWYERYNAKIENNPKGSEDGSGRILRSGSWNDNAVNSRVARRDYYIPDKSSRNNGFRLVFALMFI